MLWHYFYLLLGKTPNYVSIKSPHIKILLHFALFLILGLGFNQYASATSIGQASGIVLSNTHFFADSTFESKTIGVIEKGMLVNVRLKTKKDHSDMDEEQKFPWYQIKNNKGQTGWVFGDALAVNISKTDIAKGLLDVHQVNVKFGEGYENSFVWIARLKGIENLYEQDYMNPPYQEDYLVVTNETGESVFHYLAGESVLGNKTVTKIFLHDLTGDRRPEFFMELNVYSTESFRNSKEFIVMSLVDGKFISLFEEDLTLLDAEYKPLPSLYKFVEVKGELIRIEFVNFVNCEGSKTKIPKDPMKKFKENCIELDVSVYKWDKSSASFKEFYERSNVHPIAKISVPETDLNARPFLVPHNKAILNDTQILNIIKHSVGENNGRKGDFFYVKMQGGRRGYVPANLIRLEGNVHSDILNDYFSNQMTHTKDWGSGTSFLSFFP